MTIIPIITNISIFATARAFHGNLFESRSKPSLESVLAVINCSQTKFVLIISVLSVFFFAIFCLTIFSSDAVDVSSKTG